MTKVKCNALLATKCSLLEWKVSTKYQFKCKFSLSTRKLSTALSQEVEFDGLKTLDYSWARFFADWCMRKTLAARHHQPTRWNCGTSNRPTSHRSINKQYRPLSLRPDGVCMNMNSISVLTTSKRRNVMWTKENYKTVFLPLLLSFTIASRFILFYFLERREWQVHLHARKMRNKNRRNYYNHKCAPRGQVPSLFAMRTSRTSFICLFCYVLVIFFFFCILLVLVHWEAKSVTARDNWQQLLGTQHVTGVSSNWIDWTKRWIYTYAKRSKCWSATKATRSNVMYDVNT